MTTATERDHPPGWRAVRDSVYVDRAFDRVRSYVSASPECLFGDRAAGLHIRLGGVDVSRDVRLTHGDLETGSRFARMPLRWADARRPKLFPLLEATLEINPAVHGGDPTTQLALRGEYVPPLGRLGAAVDTFIGHRLVLQSVKRFLGELVARLERDIPPEPVRSREEP